MIIHKVCTKCGSSQPVTAFYAGRADCKKCKISSNKDRINRNIDAYLNVLLGAARQRCQHRQSVGRTEASVFDIGLSDLKDLLLLQQGNCYYSRLPLIFRQNSDWQCSLERLNPRLGYERGNIALIVCELQGASQWTQEKYLKFIELLSMKHQKQNIEWHISKKNKAPYKHKKIIKRIENGIEYWRCQFCLIEKTPDNFNINRERKGCHDCSLKRMHANQSTPHGHLKKLSIGIKVRTEKKNWDSCLDVNDLIDIWEIQGGLCAYSGIPMTFGYYEETDWISSPERKDVSKPYTRENTCLICYEFNTGDRTATAKDQSTVTGTSAWNRAKIDFIKEHIDYIAISDIRYLFQQ